MGPSNINNTLSKNVQDTRLSHKVYWENPGKLDSGIDSRGKTLADVKIQRGIFRGDAPVIITICDSDDATQIQNY